MVAAEGTEAAVLDADVGEVDVAVDDVGDHVAIGLPPERIGGGHQRQQRRAVGPEEARALVDADLAAGQCLVQHARDLRVRRIDQLADGLVQVRILACVAHRLPRSAFSRAGLRFNSRLRRVGPSTTPSFRPSPWPPS